VKRLLGRLLICPCCLGLRFGLGHLVRRYVLGACGG
jgi:hypothetical protein